MGIFENLQITRVSAHIASYRRVASDHLAVNTSEHFSKPSHYADNLYQNLKDFSIREPVAPPRRNVYSIMVFTFTATEKWKTAAEPTYMKDFSTLILGSGGKNHEVPSSQTRRFNLFRLRLMQPNRLTSV